MSWTSLTERTLKWGNEASYEMRPPTNGHRRRQWHSTPVLLPGLQSMGSWRVGQTERLHFHFSLSCIEEGNGNLLQYWDSCLENPRERGAWWAAVHAVARSQTRLSDFAFTFHCHALEKAMATHSSVLAWRIPGTGEPGGLPSMGSHRVRHDRSDLAAVAVAAWQLEATS